MLKALKEEIEAQGVLWKDFCEVNSDKLLRVISGDAAAEVFENLSNTFDGLNLSDIESAAATDGEKSQGANDIIEKFGGEFLLDPNEFVGWGVRGIHDDRHTTDLGNVGAEPSRIVGGVCYPFDVKLKRFYAWHRNNNADAQMSYGFRIVRQQKTDGANTVSSNDLYRECVGIGAAAVAPREYASTTTYLADVDLTGGEVIPAGEVVCLGVEAPTANTTNRYVQIQSGYLLFERV